MLRCVLRSPLLHSARSNWSLRPVSSSSFKSFATESKQTVESSGQAPPNQSDEQVSSEQSGGASSSSVDGSAQPTDPIADTVELQKQLQERDIQMAELSDRALRALAEMENVRMIARRDVDNARKYAIVPFAKSLLSVADNLGLALDSVNMDQDDDANTDPMLKGLFVGIKATESELLKVFSQHGISRYGALGDKFDPNKYQAMFEVPSEDHEPGTVINIQKLGYQMGERVLRPAEVGVSRSP